MTATADREMGLDAAILEYMKAKDAGALLDREAFLGRHAEHRADLIAFLDDEAQVGAALVAWDASDAVGPDSAQGNAAKTGPWIDVDGLPILESFGDYEIIAEIGRGGMGAVYRARDVPLKRSVAIKVLLADPETNPAAVVRFHQEAQLSSQLEHPGIVPVHEVGKTPNGRPYFVMKLIQGKSLSVLLRERQSPGSDLPRFLKIFEQICQTVAYAHSMEALHRDLKPENVMVGAFGEVLVMDWGLGKVVEGGVPLQNDTIAHERIETVCTDDRELVTSPGAVMGTLCYMPPEQANGNGDQIGQASDVFSLGGILCEILTGRPPYWFADKFCIYDAARNADLGPAHGRLTACGATPDLIDLARRCLAPRVEDRPATANVAGAITHYLESVQRRLREAEVEQAKQGERLAATRKRYLIRLALFATAALLLASIVGGSIWYKFDCEQRDRDDELNPERVKSASAQAATQRYFGLIGGHRERMARIEPGWTIKGLEDLAEAAKMQTPIRDEAQLRSEIASCAMGVDIREIGVVGRGFKHTGPMALHLSGKWLAIGQNWSQGLIASILVINLATQQEFAKLKILPDSVFAGFGSPGIHALAFSPDGHWLAATTGTGMVYRWDTGQIEAGYLSAKVFSDRGARELIFSPDSMALYCAKCFALSKGEIKCFRAADLKLMKQAVYEEPFVSVALQPGA